MRYHEEEHPNQRTLCMALYMITAAGGISQMFNEAIVTCIVLMVIVWFILKIQQTAAKGTIYASHAEWIARTISIAGTVLFPIALIVAAFILWRTLDIATLKKNLADENPEIAMHAVQNFMDANSDRILHVSDRACLPPTIWWVWRCVTGFWRAKNSVAIDYPRSWV